MLVTRRFADDPALERGKAAVLTASEIWYYQKKSPAARG
jgi:hypothetical protein